MKNRIVISLIIAVTATLSLVSCKPKDTSQSPKTYVIFIDGTGSYNYLDKAKQTIAQKIKEAPVGSMFLVRWITENSNADKYSIISAVLPDNSGSSSNPYKNSKTKKNETKAKTQDAVVRNKLIQEIMNAKSPNAQRTDVYGALFAATERFENYDNEKILMIFSDLADNVGNKYDSLSLNGAIVKILDFQTDKSGNNKKYWSDTFYKLGASDIEFRHPDEILTANNRK
jgi:hypothetical protein